MIQLAISSRSRCHILDAEFNHDILSTNYEDRYSINAFPPQITFCQNRRYRYRYRVITGYFSSSRLFERENFENSQKLTATKTGGCRR